jgi:uncharacterized protein (TIGR02058 family)
MTMTLKRVILEMGQGVDSHGKDYTKAAKRAVDDALHHSSLPFLKNLGIDPAKFLEVEVTIGVQKPDAVDAAAVARALPIGKVKVNVVKGGLDVIDPKDGSGPVVAMAAVAVRCDVEAHLVAKT